MKGVFQTFRFNVRRTVIDGLWPIWPTNCWREKQQRLFTEEKNKTKIIHWRGKRLFTEEKNKDYSLKRKTRRDYLLKRKTKIIHWREKQGEIIHWREKQREIIHWRDDGNEEEIIRMLSMKTPLNWAYDVW